MNLTDMDYELLSAYLDDALTAEERTRLEQRLVAEPDLRRELSALRQTVALIKQLPAIKAPRDFTLTPAMLAAKPIALAPIRIRIVPLAISALSMAASLLIVFLGVALLLNIDTPVTAPQRDNIAFLSTPTVELTPVIAFENEPQPTFGGAGMTESDMAGAAAAMATEDLIFETMMATEEPLMDAMMATEASEEVVDADEIAPPNARHFDAPEDAATADPAAATMMEVAPFLAETTSLPLPTATAMMTQAPPMPVATTIDSSNTGDDLVALMLLSLGLMGFMTSVFLGVRAFRR